MKNKSGTKTLIVLVSSILVMLFIIGTGEKEKPVSFIESTNKEVKNEIIVEEKEESSILEFIENKKNNNLTYTGEGYEKYIIVGEEYDFNNVVEVNGTFSRMMFIRSEDNNIAKVIAGNVIGVSPGKTNIVYSLGTENIKVEIVVTDLIQKMPEQFDVNKELLECGRYSEEENDLLDEILEYRINEAGYGTRGAVVAATRFLLLEFPYRLTYFYEWGRQTYDKVDGEGRYYIKGLYLDESRFSRLIGSNTGPKTWGCELFSSNTQRIEINGLDCSGFVTWALLNAGFDCGDIGSGFSPYYSLDETGELVKNTLDNLINVKTGDLVHSDYMGGHIGIIAGIDEDSYYIAQATPNKNWGVTITKYSPIEFTKEWDEIVMMDSYYKQEGIYTKMW